MQTYCLGQAASAAAVILAAGTPGKRFALANSRILIHQPYTEGGGQASDVEIQAREVLRMRKLLEELIAKHSNRTVEQVEKDIERDKILTAPRGRGVRPGRPGHHQPANERPRRRARRRVMEAWTGSPGYRQATKVPVYRPVRERERPPRGTHWRRR